MTAPVTATLSDFLLARIAEDEAAAREVVPLYFARARVAFDNMEEHFRRHDPARVLAECEAKRRIVEMVMAEENPATEFEPDYWSGWSVAADALRLLALPYADHRDYRDEWRP